MFANLDRREKIMLVVALLALVITLYYFYIYQPRLETIDQLQSTKIENQNKLDKAQMLARQLPELEKKYAVLKDKYDLRRASYIDKTQTALLIDMREAARANNVELVRFQTFKEEERIDMDVNIKGDYFYLSDLFADFSNWSYWFEFDDLRIKGVKDDLINVSMSVIFHRKPGW